MAEGTIPALTCLRRPLHRISRDVPTRSLTRDQSYDIWSWASITMVVKEQARAHLPPARSQPIVVPSPTNVRCVVDTNPPECQLRLV